ncbi:hypothetical protein FIBSPDRAFT_876884 [Athelia psychrophila]|uniref:WW domain-containing protein n=1 Tax=Athelia psychrophila TaxID=1759441 RepID=A0A167WGJ1_9AGAM|nr:hypothetical protein FIBSPDRAFT_876884 [Fibularhizoctonia sp. CBS 109695]
MSSETPAEKSATPSPSPARVIDAIEPPSQDLLEKTPQADGQAEDTEPSDDEEDADDETETVPPPPPNAWQAIFSPQHGAYYFFNTDTKETTWANPLQPEASTSSVPPIPSDSEDPQPSSSTAADTTASDPAPSATAQASVLPAGNLALQEAAIAAGIDPALAYLDPSILGKGPSGPGSYTAKFNARTGAFTAVDARDPGHLSEFERAKRMSEFYFDVGAWEKDVEERKRVEREEEENGLGKRKRPSRKDLDRFKEQKKAKKIAKTAWLRE